MCVCVCMYIYKFLYRCVLCYFSLNRILWIPKLKTGYWSLWDAWTSFTKYGIFKGDPAWPRWLTFGKLIMSSGTSIRKKRQGLSLQGVDPETCMIVFRTHWAQVMLLSFIDLKKIALKWISFSLAFGDNPELLRNNFIYYV